MAEVGTRIVTPAPTEVPTPGTAIKIPTTAGEFTTKTIVIQAPSSNEESIVVGDKNVKAKQGAHGSTEQRGIEIAKGASISINIADGTEIWVDVTKAKDAFCIMYLTA